MKTIPLFRHRLLSLATLGLGLLGLAHATQPTLPPGTAMLSPGLNPFKYLGPGDASTVVHVVPVEGRDFPEAIQVNTYDLSGSQGNPELHAPILVGAKKGDVLWISFLARCLASTRESGEASFHLGFDRLVNGKYEWPPHLERGISVGKEWTQTSIPFRMESDVAPTDARLVLSFDYYPQRFEIGPISFLNCGPQVDPANLPRSVVKYGGSEPDAPWRAAAAERIEKIRKGDLQIKVTDSAGQPVADATVTVHMHRLAFNIGTAIHSRYILDGTSPDARKYRETLLKYFNQIVFDNEMKWPNWAEKNFSPEPILRALEWSKAHDFTARAHVLVWPSWRYMAPFMSDLKNDPAALRRAVFDRIERQTGTMKGRFNEWDVTNELFAHHELLDVIGRDAIAAWYRAMHAGAPDVKLFYNEYTMFHPDGPGTEHYYDTIKSLLEQGAPLGGLGEQGHIAGSPPAIPLVLSRLDRFAQLGLPITITEFDMSVADEDFQAAYMRDFMTAIFSHPATTGFVQWGFWEPTHWIPPAALWNKDWSLRKHGQAFIDVVNSWRTDTTGQTTAEGVYRTRAFLGDYDVTVSHAGKTRTVRLKVEPNAAAHAISLP